MFDPLNQFDVAGNSYGIVPSHVGRWHVNFSEWDEVSHSYDDPMRVASNLSWDDAIEYVDEGCCGR